MTILKLVDVKYKYEGSNRYILKDINIDFEKGKVYVIMGKTQSGKSTLLSMISGLDNCTNGSIYYKNKELKNINKDIYRSKNVGIVFKENNLLNNASILDNILLSINLTNKNNREKKEIAHKLLENFDIKKDDIKTKIIKLSDYEKKKISIIRALVNNPDIIIADDPTENFNEENEEYIMERLVDLANKYDKCVIIVTSSDIPALYASEIWGLVNGKLMFIKDL